MRKWLEVSSLNFMQLDISSSSDYTVSIVNFIVVLNVTENKFYINLTNLVSLMCIHYDFVYD